MSAIGPGDWVICIDGEGNWLPGESISTGALYQVADCFTDELDHSPIVSLVGRERKRASDEFGFRVGFSLARFRPAFDGNQNTKTADAPSEREGVDA